MPAFQPSHMLTDHGAYLMHVTYCLCNFECSCYRKEPVLRLKRLSSASKLAPSRHCSRSAGNKEKVDHLPLVSSCMSQSASATLHAAGMETPVFCLKTCSIRIVESATSNKGKNLTMYYSFHAVTALGSLQAHLLHKVPLVAGLFCCVDGKGFLISLSSQRAQGKWLL
ncbi:Hypothetical predicted protein [Xyrichtys novacula]|uniref:Uncharacterized protein n=1 Tax=Xyrichtys novacula TaxID=13765 RepID=A0AAV1F9L6_XYRNO|nr:Hypothetical predicted protein [Xyrichtys novacula]CAJ1057853.1 Hypothetical predicted protein [Xyrichtys novacula]CAJ1057854.1 Hypothetical predicted protein [Xyrichtys novacula]CAJ1057855.1 Hypothetical predicted protein [Xyrichtys novacula]CAJ1057856.1 Hypothetical predicted protein [Xyrichtys novacula]